MGIGNNQQIPTPSSYPGSGKFPQPSPYFPSPTPSPGTSTKPTPYQPTSGSTPQNPHSPHPYEFLLEMMTKRLKNLKDNDKDKFSSGYITILGLCITKNIF